MFPEATYFKDVTVGFVISLVILSLSFTPVENALENLAGGVVNPLQYGFYRMGSTAEDQVEFWGAVKGLREQNVNLKKDITALQSELSNLKEVKRENEILKNQLGIMEETGDSYKKAGVIGFGASDTNSVLKINKGSGEGVEKGAVVVFENYLIGTVTEVREKSSFVLTVTDPELRVAVLDQDSKDRARGVVRGQYSTVMIMEKIFKEEEVKLGDTIITSGEDGKFPRGLILGEVTEVPDSPEGVLKSVKVSPLVEINKLETVFLLEGTGG